MVKGKLVRSGRQVFKLARWLIAAVVCILLLPEQAVASASAPAASAATIVVNSFADDIQNNGNCTLREAVQAANLDQAVDGCTAGQGADVIRLDAGTYTISIPGTFEDNNQTGDIDITSSLSIQGQGADKTIIKVDQSKVVDRIFQVIPTNAQVSMDGMTLQDGNLTTEYNPQGRVEVPRGGAVRNAGTLTVTHVSFINNVTDAGASGDGGALYNSGTAAVSDIYFTKNYASYGGGSLHNDGQITVTRAVFFDNQGYGSGGFENGPTGRAVINDSQFNSNQIGLAGGGAITQNPGAQLAIYRTTFDNNSGEGGTIFNNRATLLLEDCVFINNSQGDSGIVEGIGGGSLTVRRTRFENNYPSGGGALFANGDAQVRVEDSQFLNNVDRMNGAAITLKQSATGVIVNTIIHGNSAPRGGGIYNAGPSLTILGSEISGNVAEQQGGGIYNEGTLTLENSTLSGNTGSPGGGIFQANGQTLIAFSTITNNQFTGLAVTDGAVNLRGTILAGNRAIGSPDCDDGSSEKVKSQGGNVIGAGNGCAFQPDSGDQVGWSGGPLNPKLGPLTNNGGLTFTHALLPGSPAIDAATIRQGSCPDTDQRGVDRPQGSACDVGAFELAAVAVEFGNKLYLPLLYK